jgi:hypothetical protein
LPCLLALLIVLFPRIAIVLLYLFTNFFQGVFTSVILPVIGFILLPLTLLAYTWMVKIHQPTDTMFLVIMFIAVILDLGLIGGGARRRRG